MSNSAILFYSGKECCLCDDAEVIFNHVAPNALYTKVDVKTSTELYHLYGARIPVLKRQDSEQELGWPFNEQQLREFLS
ncbi:glutaredoxin family protein [Paraglaciecola polaris]|uniref:Thiol-disulfide isomerase and thioredoxin i n=1 Tax=Paraglaciecola polaris LMG 21857 TaxID=1129793 RepID=K6YJ64_9ALTE|nr:glutaredoxin family protein [Paraglaciecola polaris]GAC32774.1 thiol-disulfide isomerase and thioredoxin i [Paraglaciecola polaris LMG 21857]|tara:strand:+ start:3069 stop:3305 length:237 start_codon:yes stop_codon:yes gene_type:complete